MCRNVTWHQLLNVGCSPMSVDRCVSLAHATKGAALTLVPPASAFSDVLSFFGAWNLAMPFKGLRDDVVCLSGAFLEQGLGGILRDIGLGERRGVVARRLCESALATSIRILICLRGPRGRKWSW